MRDEMRREERRREDKRLLAAFRPPAGMALCSRTIPGPPEQPIASLTFSPRVHNTTNSSNHKAANTLSSKNFNPPSSFLLPPSSFLLPPPSSLIPPPSSPLYIIHNRHNFSAIAMDNPQSNLPPGFRFHPTDEELILHYLSKKLTSTPFPVSIIADVDIYKFDPWELPGKAIFGEKEWYFFSPRDRKYPNGVRPNRAAASGYWKATGTDKTIVAASSMRGGGHGNIGVKKALVFYQGRPPKGIKTNWIMHEYRLAQPPTPAFNKPLLRLRDASMRLDDWVLCRIYKKSNAVTPAAAAAATDDDDQGQEDSFMEESLKSHPNQSTIQPQKPSSLSNILDAMDSSIFGHLLSDIQYSYPTGFEPTPPVKYGSAGQSNDTLPKVPHWNSVPSMENQLKRQRSSMDGDVPCPSKKLTSSCTFTTNPNQSDLLQSYFNQSLFNQALLSNPYLQFQG